MDKRALFLPVAMVLTQFSICDAAQTTDFIRDQMQCLTEHKEIPGAITLVAKHGRLSYQSVVGFQDVASQTPMSRNTLFRLYSMTKPITSVAILMLMEDGRLTLDTPAAQFIPAFAHMRVYVSGDVDHIVTEPVNRPISIRDLLTHTSGLTYHFTGNTVVHQYYRKHGVKRETVVGSLPSDAPAAKTLEELVARLGAAPMLRQPGQAFDYSYSTTVLGYIVERVSGMRLDEFLQKRIFKPLKMSNTRFVVDDADVPRLAASYEWNDQTMTLVESAGDSEYRDSHRLLDGGGALVGTADDYLRFGEMLANEGELDGVRVLKASTVKEMLRDQLPPSAGHGGPRADVRFEFGFGVEIGNESTAKIGLMPATAAGWDGSANTFFWVDATHRAVTVFMTQLIAQGAPPVSFKKIVYDGIYGSAAEQVPLCQLSLK